MRTGAARAAQDRNPPVSVQQRGEPIEITPLGHHDRPGRQQAADFGRRCIGGGLQCDVTGDYDYRDTAPTDRLADRDLEHSRHLVGAGDQLAVMAAFFEQRLRVRFLKIPGADFGRRDLGRNGKHRNT